MSTYGGRQLLELSEPFPAKYVHTNPSGGGSYVKHHVVTQRLLYVLGPHSFELVEIVRGHVAALEADPNARSNRAKEGRPELSDAIVGVIARLRVTIDGHPVVAEEAGDCEDPHNWTTDGQRLKDAMSDAYKRCAMRLGCGLHLWSQDEYYLDALLSSRERIKGSAADHTDISPPSEEPTGSASEGVLSATSMSAAEQSSDGQLEQGAPLADPPAPSESSTGGALVMGKDQAPPVVDSPHAFVGDDPNGACAKCHWLMEAEVHRGAKVQKRVRA